MAFFRKKTPAVPAFAGKPEYIIAGLGNPGREYEYSRHNAGFLCLDILCNKYGLKTDRLKYRALTCAALIEGVPCLVMRPQTFMNNSGESIKQAADFYKIPPDHIIVIYDDVSLEPGQLRLRKKGSAGGHNGIKSVIAHLGTDVFDRIKIGVGAKPEGWDLADYVLGRVPKDEEPLIRDAIAEAAKACESIVIDGMDSAMNVYNRKKESE